MSSDNWRTYTYAWPSEVLSFSRVKFYASFPYKDEPSLQKLKLMERVNADGSRNLFVICNSKELLQEMRSGIESIANFLIGADSSFLRACQIHFAIYRQINSDLIKFLKDLHVHIRERVSVSDRKALLLSHYYHRFSHVGRALVVLVIYMWLSWKTITQKPRYNILAKHEQDYRPLI